MATTQPCVLLTGAAGFLGKVILAELLRLQRKGELPDHRIYLLIRPSKKLDSAARFAKLTQSKCFSGLEHDWIDNVKVVQGELTSKCCGLDPEDYSMICKSVTHIIHCASSIDFNLPIAEAAVSNIDNSLNVLRLSEECHNLHKVVLVSTAYVHPHQKSSIKERLAPLPLPAEELYAAITGGTVNENELLRLSGHANTYSLTKSIAEHLVSDFGCKVPITILRPSIVSAAWKYPFPGWIDSWAALGGYSALFGGGFLHVMEGDPKTMFDIVPVDVVAKHAIAESELVTYHTSSAQDRSTPREQKISIRHSVAGRTHSASTAQMLEVGLDYFSQNRVFSRPYWKYLGPKGLRYHWYRMVHQKIPLDLANGWYSLRQDHKMRKKIQLVQRGIKTVDRCFPYFCSHSFDFESVDGFDSDFTRGEYLRLICVGVHKHLLLGDK